MILGLLVAVALAQEPSREAPDTALAAGMQAMQEQRPDEALQHYRRCLELAPDHPACHWEIGWVFWTRGEWDQVVTHWRRVRALQPDHPDLTKHLPTAEGHLASLEAIRKTAADAPASLRTSLPEGKTLRIRAVGDIMLGTDFPAGYLPPDDGARLLDDVKPLLQDADLTFGNLEGPLCDGGTTNKCGEGKNCYAFRTPTRYAAYLADAGFDFLSTANNHAEDFGVECRMQTEAALEKQGIAYSGRPGTIASREVNGIRVAMIGFHTSRNSHYLNDHDTAAALVRSLATTHDIVIVSFHGGAEGNRALRVPDGMETFYGEKRGHLRQFAKTVVEAGADLVLGHGPHVPRGLQLVDGHLVAYSLGNFATYGRFNLTGHLATTLVLEVVLDHEGKLVSGAILPVKQVGRGIPERDPEGTAIDLIRSLSEQDFGDGAPRIARDGTFAPRTEPR